MQDLSKSGPAMKRPATGSATTELPDGWAVRTALRATGASKGTTDKCPDVRTLGCQHKRMLELTMGIFRRQMARSTAACSMAQVKKETRVAFCEVIQQK